MEKHFPPETIALIKGFYEDDEYTRTCPGAKEFKSIYIDGAKVKKTEKIVATEHKRTLQ